MSRRPDWSFTLDDLSNESTRKRAAASATSSLQSGGTVIMDEFSSASDLMATHEEDKYNHDGKRDLPKLPTGQGRMCWALGCCVFTCCCLLPAAFVGAVYMAAPEMVLQLLPTSLHADPAAQANARAVKRDESIKDSIHFGVWDSKQSVTPLQLQVAISMALGVRVEDEDIAVTPQTNRHFFEVRVDHGTQEELAHIESDVFLASLNSHLVQFNGNAVVTHSPRLVKADQEHPVRERKK